MVIDGVVDPIAWTTGYGDEGSTMPLGTRLGSDVGAQATLDEFFRLCDVAGPSCAFAGNSHKRFASLAGRLREHPIVITDPAPGQPETFSYQDLIMTTLGVLFDPALWPIGGVFFAEIEALASTASVGHTLDAIRTLSGHAAANQEPYANDVEGLPGVACSDSANPRTLVAWQRAAAAAEHRQVYFGRRWAWKVGACLSWPTSAGEDRYQGPWNAWTSGPVLVVGNYFDPATPYSGAVTVSKLLPNSRLLSYAGWGHTAFLNAGNVCVDNHIARYLINAQVPPTGTVCQPDRSPFAPPEASAPTAS
jgi:hypothetical protein